MICSVLKLNYSGVGSPAPHSYLWPSISGTDTSWDTLEEILFEDSFLPCLYPVELHSPCLCVLVSQRLVLAAPMKAQFYVWDTGLGTWRGARIFSELCYSW